MDYAKVSFCMILLLLSVSCTKQNGVTSVDLPEADIQEVPITADERIAILEGRIDVLTSEVQTYANTTHVVKTKKGGNTNYVIVPTNLNDSPDLNSTAHRIIPRPTINSDTSSRPTAANNRPTQASSTTPMPSASTALTTPTAPINKKNNSKAALPSANKAQTTVATKNTAIDDLSLALPPETITAAAIPTPATSKAKAVAPKPNATTPKAVAPKPSATTPRAIAPKPSATTPKAVAPKPSSNVMKAAASPNTSNNMEYAYKNALNKALAGRFNESIALFENYLQNFPNSKYAPNAYYWIGECLYAQKKFPAALSKFKDVATRYPKHHKTADALLKAGMTYDIMDEANNAALQYNTLLDNFPKSSASNIVRSWGYVR